MGTCAGVDGSPGDELEGNSASPSSDHNRSPCSALFS